MAIEIRRTNLAEAPAVIHWLTGNEVRNETLAGKAETLAARIVAALVIAAALVVVATSVAVVT